jgi:hypothetical protein
LLILATFCGSSLVGASLTTEAALKRDDLLEDMMVELEMETGLIAGKFPCLMARRLCSRKREVTMIAVVWALYGGQLCM